jgi:hypothetical protein
MRLGRSVLAGLIAGAVAGFLVALLRPRVTHPAISAEVGGSPGVPEVGVASATASPDDASGGSPASALGAWERAGTVPGASRLSRPADSTRTTD